MDDGDDAVRGIGNDNRYAIRRCHRDHHPGDIGPYGIRLDRSADAAGIVDARPVHLVQPLHATLADCRKQTRAVLRKSFRRIIAPQVQFSAADPTFAGCRHGADLARF